MLAAGGILTHLGCESNCCTSFQSEGGQRSSPAVDYLASEGVSSDLLSLSACESDVDDAAFGDLGRDGVADIERVQLIPEVNAPTEHDWAHRDMDSVH